MSKDVFLYELKAYIKFPVVLLGIWLLTAIGCGIAVPVSGDAGAEEAYGIVDGMAQLILYALCLLYTSPITRDAILSRMTTSA